MSARGEQVIRGLAYLARPRPWMLWYGTVLHLGWVVLLAASPDAAKATPVDGVARFLGGRTSTAVILVTGAFLAIVGTWNVLYGSSARLPLYRYALLLPQQILLIMSAAGGLHAAVVGHYADGVPRPWGFILADQLPVIFAAGFYTLSALTLPRAHTRA